MRHEAARLRADLEAVDAERSRADQPSSTRQDIDQDRIESIRRYLDHADAVLEHQFAKGWVGRLVGASGAYQEALASVFRASEDLVLVQSDAAVAARLPGLRAAIRSYCSADDPRREAYLLRVDQTLIAIGAERLAPPPGQQGSK